MMYEIYVDDKTLLKLRKKEDAEAIFNLVDHNRDHLRPWLPWVDGTTTPKDTAQFIHDCAEGFEKNTSADFGILHGGEWIGSMGFHKIDHENNYAEIGYWLDKEHEGKGIMTACVKAIISYGFHEQGLHRIEIRCDARNKKSRAVPERLGFMHEGTLREVRKTNETYDDTLIFGILKSEWKD